MRITLIVILIFSLFGCSTQLTKEGSDVHIVSDEERSRCTFIGTVTGVESMGLRIEDDVDSAMNKARNKAGQLGANGMKIINIDTTPAQTVVTVEALKCPRRRTQK
jgi:hypothetical protein